jgi:hypothetical protein
MSGFNKVNNMDSCIDIRTLPDNVPSLCIPRVFSNITEQRIRKVINDLNMGDIERIDMVSKKTEKGEKYNRVFIHFRKWANDGNAAIARERLVNSKEIKIVYDEPWFWKVSAYRKDAAKNNREPRPPHKHEAKKPSFCFDTQEQDRNQNQYQDQGQNDDNFRYRWYKNQYQGQNQCQYQGQNQCQGQNQNQNQNKYHDRNPRQTQRPANRERQKEERPRSPSSSPPPKPQDEVEGPSGEYVDVPKIEYGKVAFPKRKGLKAKVALTIVNPDELSPN